MIAFSYVWILLWSGMLRSSSQAFSRSTASRSPHCQAPHMVSGLFGEIQPVGKSEILSDTVVRAAYRPFAWFLGNTELIFCSFDFDCRSGESILINPSLAWIEEAVPHSMRFVLLSRHLRCKLFQQFCPNQRIDFRGYAAFQQLPDAEILT